MSRVLGILAGIAVVAAVVVLVATHKGKQPYEVRAIFDNADFVIPGEDVKVAGVKVGKIASLDVTPGFKAAVVLRIDDPGYQDFRRDASCIVRPQSLIGERFVECTPTQVHPVGQKPPPALRRIASGPGKGQYLLPVTNTQQTVDIDLIGDTLREPERERLSLILNELGTGLAGRGKDLNAVIRRADPALQSTDKVLAILASQNTTLEQLATASDTVLAPLAREREHVASAIRNSSDVAEATAEKRGALAQDIQTLPAFLDELKPTMTQLGSLADASTPVFADLHAGAPEINTLVERLGPFAQAATPAVDTLGDAAKVGTPAVTAARPVITDLNTFATAVRPVATTADQVLTSFSNTGGIERAMDYIFYQAAAINGFDGLGHYLRAELLVNQCSVYAVKPVAGCSANFPSANASSAAVASAADASGEDPVLAATARALSSALNSEEAKAKAEKHKAKAKHKSKAKHKHKHKAHKPASKHPRKGHGKHKAHKPAASPTPAATGAPETAAAPTPGAATPAPGAPAAPAATATPTPTPNAADALLNYLFGHGGGG